MAKKNETLSMVVRLSKPDRAKLKMIQAKLEEMNSRKTLSDIASDCLVTGIYAKLKDLG